jgi:integrase
MNNIIVFIRDKVLRKDGTAPVCLQIFINKKKREINTGVVVLPSQWDAVNRKIRKSKTDDKVDDKNLIIRDCVARANDIFVKYHLLRKDLTVDLFESEYYSPASGDDFYDFMKNEIEFRKENFALGTYKHHKSTLNKMKRFKKSLAFCELDFEFLQGFRAHMKKLKNCQNTINGTLKRVKYYTDIAIKKSLMQKNPFLNEKLTYIDPEISFLTETELKFLFDLYRKKRLKDHLQRVLRHYLFGCFTGLRISDIKKLQRNEIVENILVFSPQKGSTKRKKIVRVPLSAPALQLILDENSLHKSLVFPLFYKNDQTTNKFFKQIIEVWTEFDKHLTFHSSRHTFAVIYLNRNPGDFKTLQELLGHSKIDDTFRYAKILTATKEKGMKFFDTF